MKTFELHEAYAAGNTDTRNIVYKVNGKRVDRAAWDELDRNPRAQRSCFYNTQQGGVWHHYKTLTLEASAVPELEAKTGGAGAPF